MTLPSALSPRTAIVAAMREEVAVLCDRLSPLSDLGLPQCEAFVGVLQQQPILLLIGGVGPVQMGRSVNRLLRVFSPKELLLVGIGGGLSPDLKAEETVLADRVVTAASGKVLGPTDAGAGLLAQLEAQSHGRTACLTTENLVLTAAEKASLAERFRDQNAGIVDLESAAFAEEAARAKCLWRVLRVVSDTADENLPQFLEECYSPSRGIGRHRAALCAVRSPTSWPQLFQLKRRVDRSSRIIADTLGAKATGSTFALRRPTRQGLRRAWR